MSQASLATEKMFFWPHSFKADYYVYHCLKASARSPWFLKPESWVSYILACQFRACKSVCVEWWVLNFIQLSVGVHTKIEEQMEKVTSTEKTLQFYKLGKALPRFLVLKLSHKRWGSNIYYIKLQKITLSVNIGWSAVCLVSNTFWQQSYTLQ